MAEAAEPSPPEASEGREGRDGKTPAADGGGREAASRTFFTSIDAEHVKKKESAKLSTRALEATAAGPRILEHHQELKNLALTLDQRMAALLNEHEKDFFLAYKTHMYTVQREIKALRVKADREEEKTRQDTTIKSLEGELDWFMTEALRLDELCKDYKKKVDKWKQKSDALDEDRRFLEDQIKGAKRQNKILRAAAERARSSAYSALMVTKARSEAQAELTLPALAAPPAARSAPRRPSSASAGRQAAASMLEVRSLTPQLGGHHAAGLASASSAGSLLSAGGQLALGYPHAGLQASQGQSVLGSEAEERYIQAIQHLKEAIIKEQHAVRTLQASRAMAYSKKSELEEFFLKCVDEARKELIRKRHMTMNKPKSEKDHMLEAMLNNEDVLVCLYEKLFPHRTGMARSLDGAAMSDASQARIPSNGQLWAIEAR